MVQDFKFQMQPLAIKDKTWKKINFLKIQWSL